MENNNHIDQLFKGALKNFESRPINDIWSQIEERLNNEDAPATRINYARYAAAIFIFLTLSLITVPLTKKTSNFTDTLAFELPTVNSSISFSQQEDQPADNIFQAASAEINDDARESGNFIKADETLIEPVALTGFEETEEANFIFVPNDEEANETKTIKKVQPERVFNHDVPLNAFTANTLPEHNDYQVVDREIDESMVKIELRGMYIGASASYNQTSLIEYGNIFRGERPIQPSLKFGTSKGIAMGYNFNNKFGVQVDYIYNSVQGQNYVTSEGEVVTEKTLALYYDHVSLSSRFKQARMSDLTNHPVVVNYIAGFQYGMLRDYRLPQEKRWESDENLFKSYDWSILLGLDYDIYLQKNLFLSLGARGSISTDISTHNIPLDDYAKRNFVFGVRGGLNYVFR